MEEITTIVNQLKLAKDLYYNKGTSPLTDAEFDSLEKKLKELDPENSYFNDVGAPLTRGQKFKHLIPMGSLNQVNSTEEILNWARKSPNKTLFGSDKLDGNSIAIYYDGEFGLFEAALTRGDGIEGLDITRHVNRMLQRAKPPIPQFASPGLVVRCEAIFKVEDFEKHVTGYKNPRNYVAGQLNRTVANQEFIDFCDIIAFSSNLPYSHSEELDNLHNQNFNIVRNYQFDKSNVNEEELSHFLKEVKKSSPYELDGIVLEFDKREERDALGFDGLNPVYAVKFKVNQEYVDSTVINVEWNPSKHGFMKPRVQIEPVELAGVTISFATGFNAKFIQDNGIGPGAVVRVKRSGEVIPFLSEVITKVTPQMPILNINEYAWTKTGVDIVLNELPDESNIKSMVEFFASLDVAQLKIGNVTTLHEAGFTTIQSIIKATEDELNLVLGENGIKAYMSLRDKLSEVNEYVFAGSLSLFDRGIGKRKMKALAEMHGDLSNLTYEQILNTSGFDELTANKIIEGLPAYREILNDLKEYVGIKKYEAIQGTLNGVAVVFTGVRNKELEKMIESKGGKVLGSYTKATTHVVAKDPNGKSGKLDKARKAGVEIISLEEAQSRWL